jgi:hypothetical protein
MHIYAHTYVIGLQMSTSVAKLAFLATIQEKLINMHES